MKLSGDAAGGDGLLQDHTPRLAESGRGSRRRRLSTCRRSGPCADRDQSAAGAQHHRSDDRPRAPLHALAEGLGGSEPPGSATAQAAWSLFQPRVYSGHPMFTGPRAYSNRAIRASE